MDLLEHFRKGLGSGWVCTSGMRITLDNGKTIRLRPGQAIYTGDFRYQGADLALMLDMLAGSPPAGLAERPQSIRAAITPG